jgi:hypothetical protein
VEKMYDSEAGKQENIKIFWLMMFQKTKEYSNKEGNMLPEHKSYLVETPAEQTWEIWSGKINNNVQGGRD